MSAYGKGRVFVNKSMERVIILAIWLVVMVAAFIIGESKEWY